MMYFCYVNPSKDEIKRWLKASGRSREWLGKQCGGISKRAVDNWLSSDRDIPAAHLTIIRRLMEDDAHAAAERAKANSPQPQNLVLEVDLPTFERWSKAALSHGEIITEYATRVIEEAARRDIATPFLKAAEDPAHYVAPSRKRI